MWVCVLQAVYYGTSLSSIILLLPFIHLSDEFEEWAFGDGCVAVHGPTQKLELLYHPVAVLRLNTRTASRLIFSTSSQCFSVCVCVHVCVFSPVQRYRCGIFCWWYPPLDQRTQTPPEWGRDDELRSQASTEDTAVWIKTINHFIKYWTSAALVYYNK